MSELKGAISLPDFKNAINELSDEELLITFKNLNKSLIELNKTNNYLKNEITELNKQIEYNTNNNNKEIKNDIKLYNDIIIENEVVIKNQNDKFELLKHKIALKNLLLPESII